jgi:predicted PurR-regulated permease PerM
MRYLKLALISTLIFFLLFIGFTLLLPSHLRVSRAINIEAPIEKIHPQVASLDKWQSWNTLLSDSAVDIISVTPSQIKAKTLQIEIQPGKTDSVFTKWSSPKGESFNSSFSFTSSAGTTVVQWYFDFYFKWPWEKFGSMVYDQRMGPGMEKSLTQLKGLVETSH